MTAAGEKDLLGGYTEHMCTQGSGLSWEVADSYQQATGWLQTFPIPLPPRALLQPKSEVTAGRKPQSFAMPAIPPLHKRPLFPSLLSAQFHP